MTSRATKITAVIVTLVAASAIAAPAALADPPYNTSKHVTYVPPDPPLRNATLLASTAGQVSYVPPDPPVRAGTSVASLSNLISSQTQAAQDAASGSTGFSWSAAAIGALATAAMCVLVFALVLTSRRSNAPKPA
jgi:hypothetical protein